MLQQKHVLQLLLLAKQLWFLNSSLPCSHRLNVDGLLHFLCSHRLNVDGLLHFLCLRQQLLLPIHSTSAAVVSSSRPQPVSSVTMTEEPEPEVSGHASLRIRPQQDANSLHARASKTPYTTIHHLHTAHTLLYSLLVVVVCCCFVGCCCCCLLMLLLLFVVVVALALALALAHALALALARNAFLILLMAAPRGE